MEPVYAIVGVALALLVALGVPRLFTRRARRIADAIEAFRQEGYAKPLRLAEADMSGDEMARLAAQVERLGEQIASQRAALARASRQQGELLANVAHDLRTPLASMQGYLELLLLRHDGLDNAEAHNYLQTAARQSERLGRLVADLFELTRLEAEGTRPDAEVFALAELANDVAQRFALDAQKRGVRLETCAGMAAAPLSVRADIGLVERVLAGLVENALRHTPAGGSVTLEARPAAGRANVAVSDTGEGIAAADLPGVFDRYYRAERVGPASRVSGHGGLGLAIARRIVELHDGKLNIESTPGRGTRIAFDLPLAETGALAA